MIPDPLTSNINTTASGINQTAINLEVRVLVGHSLYVLTWLPLYCLSYICGYLVKVYVLHNITQCVYLNIYLTFMAVQLSVTGCILVG